MKKERLETFIKKYSLGKICEKSHWISDATNKTLLAKTNSEEAKVFNNVIMKNWEGFEDAQLAIPSASKVKGMLNPIGDEVSITLNKIGDRVVWFSVEDQNCEAVCTVAEFDAFPETPNMDDANLPQNFEVEIQLTAEFVAKMVKAIAALNEAKDFVLMNSKRKTLDMIINYEDTNTNRIRIPTVTTEGMSYLDTPQAFSTEVLKAIIAANAEHENAVLRVSERGLATIEFEDDNYKSAYFLFGTRQID